MRDIDRYQQDYLDNPFESEMVRYRHRKTVETIDKVRPESILEVGCGLVPLYKYYSGFKRLLIVEPSPEFAGKAKEGAPSSVEVIQDLLNEKILSDENSNFDLIVLSSLLHEIEDPLTLLRTAARFAGPGSTIHINVPNANSLHRLLAVKMGLIKSVEEKSERQIRFQQSHTFSIETLKALVVSAGLEVVHSESFFIKPFTHSQMQSLLDTEFMNEQMLDGLYELSADLPDMGAEIVLNARLAS